MLLLQILLVIQPLTKMVDLEKSKVQISPKVAVEEAEEEETLEDKSITQNQMKIDLEGEEVALHREVVIQIEQILTKIEEAEAED